MANTFLTPQQVVERMRSDAREQVAQMPMDLVRQFADYNGSHHLGVSGAVLIVLIMAAKERLAGEPGRTEETL